MSLTVYLSGEIHTDWRDQITEGARGLDAVFTGPVTDHAASDDCGVRILGEEPDKFWHDNKGANVNTSTSNGTRRSMPAMRPHSASH